jgi:hypothetical protein
MQKSKTKKKQVFNINSNKNYVHTFQVNPSLTIQQHIQNINAQAWLNWRSGFEMGVIR